MVFPVPYSPNTATTEPSLKPPSSVSSRGFESVGIFVGWVEEVE